MKIVKKVSRLILLVVLLAIGVGVLYEQVSLFRTRRTFPLTGHLVRVGDHLLHYTATGTHGPVVVFESGLDTGGSLPWERVVRQVASFATAVTYDRAGIQRSERGTQPKTGAAMALDLHELLHQAGYQPPYLLVGHSLAGLMIHSFVAKYPQEVRSIVLVEASHPDMLKRLPAKMTEQGPPPRWVIRLATEVGLVSFTSRDLYEGTQPNDRLNVVAQAFMPPSVDATVEEAGQLPALLDEARKVTSFDDIPLRVITSASPTHCEGMGDAVLVKQVDQVWGSCRKTSCAFPPTARSFWRRKAGTMYN